MDDSKKDWLEQSQQRVGATTTEAATAESDDSGLKSLLESGDATRISHRPELGRVVVANRDFLIGDIILREAPVLVWHSGDWMEFLEGVDSLPDIHKRGVFDMFHPSLNSAACLPLKQIGANLPIAPFPIEKRVQLLAIASANAHAYYGRTNIEYHETSSMFPASDRSKTALFLYASKAPHSCHPNASYSSKTSDGKLEYKCIRPIHAGEMVAFSYIDNLFETSTPARRGKLLQTRDFLCQCPRCSDRPDDTRRIRCPNCTTDGGWAMCTYGTDLNEIWTCHKKCGVLDSSQCETIKQKENEWTALLMHLRMLAMRDVTSLDTSEALRGVKEATQSLSPTHYLVIQMLAELTRVAASQAAHMSQMSLMAPPQMAAMIRRRFGSPKDLRMKAATIGILRVRRSECCAAQCTTCDTVSLSSSVFPHEAIYQCTSDVFFATRDLLEYDASSKHWSAEAKEMTRRYLLFMKINFGNDATAMVELERLLEETGSANFTTETTTARSSSTTNATTPRERNNSKKKKNKKKKGRR